MAKIQGKQWYQSKTIWLAIITGAIGIVTAFHTQFPMVGAFITATSILNMALRFVTSEPIL